MTPEQRLRAARAFWVDKDAINDQIQAVAVIADRMKFRTKTVLALDVDRKAKYLASMSALPDTLAARALVVYHLAEQRPMMIAFLDALGIAHEDGLIQNDDITPDASKVGAAAARIAQEFPPETVSLYLNTLLSQDPETWAGLAAVPQRLHQPAS